ALAERGKIALTRGGSVEAEAWLREAVALAPAGEQAVFGLHQCLVKAGKRKEANETSRSLERNRGDTPGLKRAMEEVSKSPDDFASRCEAGEIFLRNHMYDDGVQWLKLSLDIEPKYAPAHRALAEYYERAGDSGRAEQHRLALEQLQAQP